MQCWTRLHGFGKKLALSRLSFTRDPRKRASFRTANSPAISDRICSAPCKRIARAQVQKFVLLYICTDNCKRGLSYNCFLRETLEI